MECGRVTDTLSESRVPVTSKEGPVSHVNYKISEGVQKKINKLNLAQLHSSNN